MKKNLFNRLNRVMSIAWLFYTVQFLITLAGLLYYIGFYEGVFSKNIFIQPSYVVGLLLLLLIINGYFLRKDRRLYKRIQIETDSREDAFLNIEKLNRDLRAQRHDFLNHIQVLYSLMELEEYEETGTYLNHLYGDIIKVGTRIKTDSVSVNALLQAKANEAEKKKIHFDILLKSRLTNLPIGEWEFCRILGNLIDNGFEALSKSSQPNKVLTIQIYETIKSIEIRIRNNGPFIDEKIMNKIFEAGVSTKQDKADHGMGLYIVKKLLEDEGHNIALEQEGDVCFHITLNKS